MHQILTEQAQAETVTRLRYVSDGFAADEISAEAAFDDMTYLCQNMALPAMTAPRDDQTVIISLADRAAPFGVMDASISQIFEVFTIQDDICIWEPL